MNYLRNTKKVRKLLPRSEYAKVRRGDIYYADLSSATVGSEQGGTRPVLIIQNDIGNRYSPTVIAASITSQNKRGLPTHIELKDENYGLSRNSTIMLEQVRTIDKTRLREKIGHLDQEMMDKVNNALFVSLGIDVELLGTARKAESPLQASKAGMRRHRYVPDKKKSGIEKYRVAGVKKYRLGELERMKSKEMKLRKVNASADGEKVKARIEELWKGASAEMRRRVKKLADLNVYRIIKNSSMSGNISESATVALSWGLGISPFYVTGAADEKGSFTVDLLGEFLKKQGYGSDFIESYVTRLLELDNVTVKSVAAGKTAEAASKTPEPDAAEFDEIFAALQRKPDRSGGEKAQPVLAGAEKAGSLEIHAAVDNLLEEEVVTLMRALLIRAQVKGGKAGELAAQIKMLLLLD